MSEQASFSCLRSRLLASLCFCALVLIPAIAIELIEQFSLLEYPFPFRYDRELSVQGQFWRFVTGHFDHFSWNHLVLNAGFLAALLVAFDLPSTLLKSLCGFLLICLCSSVLMFFLSPSLIWYVGLSSGLYGLLAYCLLSSSKYEFWIRFLILLVLVVKVVYESVYQTGQAMSGIIGGAVAVDSHLYGVLAGVALFLVSQLYPGLSKVD